MKLVSRRIRVTNEYEYKESGGMEGGREGGRERYRRKIAEILSENFFFLFFFPSFFFSFFFFSIIATFECDHSHDLRISKLSTRKSEIDSHEEGRGRRGNGDEG